jgi:hypothetical protein
MDDAIDDDYVMGGFAARAFESQIKGAVSAQFPPAAINHVREAARPTAFCAEVVCPAALDVPLSNKQLR